MNCVLFGNMDQVFSLRNKTLKKYLEKPGDFVSPETWEPCNYTRATVEIGSFAIAGGL